MSYPFENKSIDDILGGIISTVDQPYYFTSTAPKTKTVRINTTAENHIVEIDLPGVKKSDCKIELFQMRGSSVRVSVRATRKINNNGSVKDEVFSHEFVLEETREDTIKATLQDGVLTLRAPIDTKAPRRKVLELQ